MLKDFCSSVCLQLQTDAEQLAVCPFRGAHLCRGPWVTGSWKNASCCPTERWAAAVASGYLGNSRDTTAQDKQNTTKFQSAKLLAPKTAAASTWHSSRGQRAAAGRGHAGRGAHGGWRGSADAWQVGRGVRGKGRLGRVALLSLTAGHTGGADARTQDGLGAGGQVIDGAGQILGGRESAAVQEGVQRQITSTTEFCF